MIASYFPSVSEKVIIVKVQEHITRVLRFLRVKKFGDGIFKMFVIKYLKKVKIGPV